MTLRQELDHAFVAAVAAVIMAGFMASCLVGCPGGPPPPPRPPPAPTPVDGGAAACGDVCVHMRALGCKEGEPTPKGATCEAVCDNLQSSGVVAWNLGCRASVASCAALDACER